MTESKPTEPIEAIHFIICVKCACISFEQEDIARRYCSICKKTHQSADEYFVVEDATTNPREVFCEFFAVLAKIKAQMRPQRARVPDNDEQD